MTDVGGRGPEMVGSEMTDSMSGSEMAESATVGARTVAIAVAFVGAIVALWILAIPPSAGPDEPNHLVRGAALVRGQLEPIENIDGTTSFEVPPWIGFPDPVCYAFEPFAPASCAAGLPRPDGPDVPLATRAAGYQVWGHLLPGVGTLGPAGLSPYLSRLLDALVPIALVGAALAAMLRRGWSGTAGLLLSLTPLAWFVFAVVNPSGLVVAGGVALWAGLVAGRRAPARLHAWLMALGWAALTLPRRDGLIWAVLILSIALVALPLGLREWWRTLGRGPQIVVGASTVATMAWAARSDTAAAFALLLAPLVPVAVAGLHRAWNLPVMRSRVRRVIAVVVAVPPVVAVTYAVMAQPFGGLNRGILRNVVGQTGAHLDETIGLLGWLDTPVPASMVLLWMVALGALVGAALMVADWRALGAATATLAIAIYASWVLEMAQGNYSGNYWQGRYYLPLLVGVPLVLGAAGWRTARAVDVDRVGRVVGVLALVVINVAFAAAMRRWGVGIAGPMVPWSWDTYGAPLPPTILLGAHVAGSGGLWWWIDRRIRGDRARSATGRPAGNVAAGTADAAVADPAELS